MTKHLIPIAINELTLSNFDPNWQENIRLVKQGFHPSYLVNFAKNAAISRDRIYLMLGLSRSTIEKKIKDNELLNLAQSERVLGLYKLVSKLSNMLPEKCDSGMPTVCAILMEWLEAPMPALNGKAPFKFMDISDGQNMVLNLLDKIETGTYA